MKKCIWFTIVGSIHCSTQIEQRIEPASKGACIEASFILQNKHNAVLEHMQKVKKQLESARITQKKLTDERTLISKKLENNKDKEKLPCILAMLDQELHHVSLIAKLYPAYTKELDMLSLSLNKTIGELTDNETISYEQVRKEVDKAFTIKEKIETEAQILNLFFEINKQSILLNHKKHSLAHKKKKAHMLTPNERTLPYKSIKLLQDEISKLQVSIREKQKILQELKKSALKLHQDLYKERQSQWPSIVKNLNS